MVSQIDICNRALLSVGARTQISSLSPSDGSVESNACSVLFQPTFESLARAAQWGCLRAQQALSLLAAAQGTPENPTGITYPLPSQPWLYSYEYPSNALAVRWIVPSFPALTGDNVPPTTINNAAGTWLPSGGQIPYQIQTAPTTIGTNQLVIDTNQSQAQAVFTLNNNNPAIWDSLFQSAMVASLAAFLVPALSLDVGLMNMQIKNAEAAIAIARAVDGNEGVTVMDHVPDWFAARSGAQGYNGWNFSIWAGQVFNMNWPGGAYYG